MLVVTRNASSSLARVKSIPLDFTPCRRLDKASNLGTFPTVSRVGNSLARSAWIYRSLAGSMLVAPGASITAPTCSSLLDAVRAAVQKSERPATPLLTADCAGRKLARMVMRCTLIITIPQ